jgi:ATP-dependent RNA helicase DDX49/DBP8
LEIFIVHCVRRAQEKRVRALKMFKSSQARVLVVTDVGSRGLDIPEVELVINFNIPAAAREYVHRVGRTARAGRGGRAVSLVSQYDIELVQVRSSSPYLITVAITKGA